MNFPSPPTLLLRISRENTEGTICPWRTMPPTICNAFHRILPSSDSRTSTLPLFYDIAVHAGLGELFAQLGYLGLKLRHGAGGRGPFGRRAAPCCTHPVSQCALGMVRHNAASSSVMPCVRTSFTASSRSSGM